MYCNNKNSLSYIFLGAAWSLFDADRNINNYGTDTPLSTAEIHMIMHIKDNPKLHVSALAEKIGVTKGAVSQTVKKLVQKKMVIKVKHSHNHSMTLLKLTSKGETANTKHKMLHEKFEVEVERLLAEIPPTEAKAITKFITDLNNFIKNTEL